MELFNLPNTTRVNRVIPKNSFDRFTTSKQRKLLSELVAKITWTHKISADTINLEAKDVIEIQLFKIELKKQQDIQLILDVIDKAIPYNIVFTMEYNDVVYISTSSKHSHPTNEDKSVIDGTFKSVWFKPSDNTYSFNLRKSIDTVYHDFCVQLSGKSSMASQPMQELIDYKNQVTSLDKQVKKIEAEISNCQQFNVKVELNLRLNKLKKELKLLTGI